MWNCAGSLSSLPTRKNIRFGNWWSIRPCPTAILRPSNYFWEAWRQPAGAVAVTQAGWNYRLFVRGMFALAVALAACAIFWRRIAPQVPALDETFVVIAYSPMTWIVGMLVVVFYSAWWLRGWRDRRQAATSRSTRPADPAKAPITQFTPAPIVEAPVLLPSPAPIAEPEPSSVDEFGRIFVGSNVTPAYLVGLLKQGTVIRAVKQTESYIGKWMKLSGILDDVLPAGGQVMVTFKTNLSLHDVIMYFNVTWIDRLSILSKGDKITVLGKIDKINVISVYLENCELKA